MRRSIALVATLTLAGAASGHSFSSRHSPTRLTLWAWERPEDLRFLASTRHPAPGTSVRVAFLDRTVRFDDGHRSIRYRQQPLLVSPDTPLTSVVRIETRGRAPSVSQAGDAAAIVVQALRPPRTDALQIDFDARASDRPFYAALLKAVRAGLARGTRLSITALASWCEDDPWIDARDVDEITPMLFRMGPESRHVLTRLEEDGRWPVEACNGAAGLSTDERYGRLPPARSVYVFNPRAWTSEDLRALPGN